MKAEKTPEEQLVDIVSYEVNRIMRAHQGSGATVEDPCQLGRMHALLAPMTEKMLVSVIYGKEDSQWFDAGRNYHKNGALCEQRVRLDDRSQPKPAWAQPGHTYSVFFDISSLTHEAPIPEDVRQLFIRTGSKIPIAKPAVDSGFPIVEVQAKNAVEAARVISRHLRAVEAQGWKVGRAWALLDNWRNEYELTKGNEKRVMQFDMRPCLLSDSSLNLTMLTLLVAQPNGEQALQKFEHSGRPNAASKLTNATGATIDDETSLKLGMAAFPICVVLTLGSAIAVGTLLHSGIAGVITAIIAGPISLWCAVRIVLGIYQSLRRR